MVNTFVYFEIFNAPYNYINYLKLNTLVLSTHTYNIM